MLEGRIQDTRVFFPSYSSKYTFVSRFRHNNILKAERALDPREDIAAINQSESAEETNGIKR